MLRHALRLNCSECRKFTEYEDLGKDDGDRIQVKCEECGKRHTSERLYLVDTANTYQRDEVTGELLEDLP